MAILARFKMKMFIEAVTRRLETIRLARAIVIPSRYRFADRLDPPVG